MLETTFLRFAYSGFVVDQILLSLNSFAYRYINVVLIRWRAYDEPKDECGMQGVRPIFL